MVLLWMLAAFVAGYIWATKQDAKYIKRLEIYILSARDDVRNTTEILAKAGQEVIEHRKDS